MTNSEPRLVVFDQANEEICTIQQGNPSDVSCQVETLGCDFYSIRLLGKNLGFVVAVYQGRLSAYAEAARFLQAVETIDDAQAFEFAPDETVAPCDIVNACEEYFSKMLNFDRGIRHETQDAPPF